MIPSFSFIHHFIGPGSCHYITADLSKLEGIESLVNQLAQKESSKLWFNNYYLILTISIELDILVNNAGGIF
jgi:NAD(P)-dependent dehydrogenase (short-subunit alcohol dehydrogenase family)